MKQLSILLILVSALGCMTERRAINKLARIQAAQPQLFAPDTLVIDSSRTEVLTLRDTLRLPGSRAERTAVTALSEIIEVLELENDRLRVRLTTTPSPETDTRTWHLSGEAKPVETVREVKVPVRQYIFKRSGGACTVQRTGWPGWSLVVSGLVTALLTWFFGPPKGWLERALKRADK